MPEMLCDARYLLLHFIEIIRLFARSAYNVYYEQFAALQHNAIINVISREC